MDDRSIQFIDSEYRELFRIPDGGSIRITYPPGDGRGFSIRSCKYLDEYHFNIGVKAGGNAAFGETYHICQFAEAMERIGAKYEPAEQLRGLELLPCAAGEEYLYTFNREEGNACIGHISGDFGRQGDRFHQNWSTRDGADKRDTADFHSELHRAVYALRQELLKDRAGMEAYCRARPRAKLRGQGGLEVYGFRLETESRQYYVRCTLGQDGGFMIYPYDKTAPAREKEQTATPPEDVAAAEIIPGSADDRKMFYSNTEDGNLCVGYLRGDFGRDGREFHHSWFEQDGERKTPEFQAEFQAVMEKLREGALKDLSASRSFCYAHPDARLPDREDCYGFKLETDSRNYFLRCTALAGDYFYVFAYDKPAPVIEHDPPEAKPSVLGRIREAKAAPKPPRKPKTPGKRKDSMEL